MKCTFFSAIAIVAALGVTTTASAQYQNVRYSSYGAVRQEAPAQPSEIDDISPSDIVRPPSAVDQLYQNEGQNSYGAPGQHPGHTVVNPTPPAMSTYQSGSGCAPGANYNGGHVYNPGPTYAPTAGYGGGCDTQAGCAAGAVGAGYAPQSFSADSCAGSVGADLIRSNDRNVVFGLRGLVFDRNYEDQRLYGTNWVGDTLYSDDTDFGALYGFEASLGVRKCNGRGWEVGYWGLFPETADVTFFGTPFMTGLTGLNQLDLGGQMVDATFNTADNWRTYRNNEFHNLEFNLLRNAGCAPGFAGGTTNIEWIAGVRWLRFAEDIRLLANNSQPGYPMQAIYDVDVDNNLLGFQLGARADRCLTQRVSVVMGAKFGVYNNRVSSDQRIHDGLGNYAMPNAGPWVGADYNLMAEEDNLATIGELDLGLNWQLSCQWRANVGYRAFGISGVALAPEQIPYDFTDFNQINNIQTNGNLFLHGAYFGLERAF